MIENGDLLTYAILALAVFRITRLITTDVVLAKLREKIWRRFPPENGGIGYLITCDWCASFWVSSLVVTMYKIIENPTVTVCSVFALSAVAGLLNRAN